MPGKCYEKISCEACGSSDAKQTFQQEDGSFDATCFRCGVYDPNPYQDRRPGPPPAEVSPEDRARAVANITDTYPIRSIEERGLSQEVCDYLGIRVAVAETDGRTITQHFYPSERNGEITGYEVRICNPKRFYAIGDRRDIDLFGWDRAKHVGGRKLFITEDVLSCASVIQEIRSYSEGSTWSDRWPAVVSLPKGSGSAAAMIERHRKDLDQWSEIILMLDQDDAGQRAEDTIIQMLGRDRVKVCKLPLKDPNDMVKAGRGKELAVIALFRGKTKRYDGVKDVSDFIDAATKPPEWGLSWPWPSATAASYGIRLGEIHIVGAAPKIGKTDHQHQLAEHLVHEHGLVVGLFDLENPGGKTLRKLAGKFAHKPFHRPDIKLEPGEIERACIQLDGKVKFYDSSNDRDWDAVKSAVVSMNKVDGVQYFFIDPLTALISKMEASSANDALNLIMTELAQLCQTLPATFFLYSHVNPPKTGKPHEEGGRVLSAQFTGSRAMEKWAHYGWGIERNREADDVDERNTATVRLLFDREYGIACHFPVVYDPDKNTFLEPVYSQEEF